jgi:hypothetical protein
MTRKPLWMVRLAGTQEEMGAQHGRLSADDAVRLFRFYRTLPERALAGDAGPIAKAAVRAVATTRQSRLVRDRPADHAARTRAFVEAVLAARPDAGGARSAELAIACMDSLQNCVSLAGRAKLGPFGNPLAARARAAAIPACSTVVAWGDATSDGELLFARNFDFPGVGVWDAAPAFVVCAPSAGQRYGFFTTRGADAPVVTVVNEAGLVLAPHTRWHRGVGFGGAMIVDLIHAIARRAETLADAIAIARERPVSSSWGIAVGSAREKSAIALEIAGPQVEVVRPHGDYLVCTNRYRTESLQAGELSGSHAWALHSDRREKRLRALVEARTAPLDAATLARFLGDRCDPATPGMRRHLGALLAQPTNVHAAVVAPAARRALVGVDAAPTCEGTWAELAWSWDGPAGAWELGDDAPGFTAAARTDIAAPHDEATRHVHVAANAYENSHDVPAARAAIDRAIACDPDDPSLRLAATWLALEARAPDRAVVHVHAGLAHERDAYRRGQLLLWGARAARAHGDAAQARRWQDELAHLPGADLDELRAASTRRWRGRPHANLMMADAY